MTLRNLIYQSIVWRGLYFVSVLGLNIMIARYYEASYSGLIYFVTNSFALVVATASLSLESGVAYYTASGKISASVLANFSLVWSVLATVIVSFIIKFAISQGWVPVLYNDHLFSAISYIAGCLLVNFFTAAFYALKNFALPNIIMTVVNLLLICLVPLTGTTFISESSYIYIYFAGFLAQGVLVTLFFYTKYGFDVQRILPTTPELLKIFRYGFIALAANLLFFLVYRIDYWFVEKYCTPEALGNYIQVSKLVQMLFILPMIMASAVFPSIVEQREKKLGEKIKIIASSSLLLYLFICVLFALTGYWLFPFVFGKTFSEMYYPFLMLIPGVLALVMLYPISAYYAGLKKIKLNVMALTLALVVIILGNLIFTPIYGIVGAASVSSAGYLAYHLFLTWYFRKEYGLSVKNFYTITFSDFSRMKQMVIENINNRATK